MPLFAIWRLLVWINNKINVYQPLDLTTTGIIKFGANNLHVNNGTSDVVIFNSSTIDSSANLNLLNSNPSITYKT